MGASNKGKGGSTAKEKRQFSWILFIKTFKQIWPYIWPSKKLGLQLRFIFAFLIIGINRGLNVLIPIFYKEIVDNLHPYKVNATAVKVLQENLTAGEKGPPPVYPAGESSILPYAMPNQFRWDLILILIILKLLSGPGGYLNCVRGLIWIPVLQNAQKKMRLKIFHHIHSLSVKWHQENKRTGAIVTLTDRGVLSMNHIISNLVFNVLPTLLDIIIAFLFFVTVLNIWTAVIVFSSIMGYLVATVFLSEWRTKFKKGMVKADNERSACFVDSVINSETVKCFTGEQTEMQRYEEKIDDLQAWDFKSDSSSKMIMFIQRTLMMAGSLGVSMLVAWYVWIGKFTTGDFILFSTYVEQLYSPLSMFSACYRILQDACLNMEHMLSVLKLEPEITDAPNATELKVPKGEISFNQVYFRHNPSKPILKDINFTISPGQTYAIVGDSGGGKSTILKLLMRFYDVTMGSITIDGQDISKVTQQSLRRNIGVVPQIATLFNQDISYNIRYSRNSANTNEIEEAAKEAQIHDKILTLPEEYKTTVGENGVKLSGGEKRRVVIARTILEGANIILLDEPTTGLDLKTEDKVQTSLNNLCKEKTTIVVSHHLSPITNADKILVVKDGQIMEQGTHKELRELRSHYEELWLLEHPEDNQEDAEEFSASPDFSCKVPNCSCYCHDQDNEQNDNRDADEKVCEGGIDCHCNCHDLQVETLILDMLKQESEEGIMPDEDDPYLYNNNLEQKGGERGARTPPQSPQHPTSPISPTDILSNSRRYNSDSGDVLLQTIHEVPSTEEKDENGKLDNEGTDVTCETDPLMGSVSSVPNTPRTPGSSTTPKLGKLAQQFSFDHGVNDINDLISKDSTSPANISPLPNPMLAKKKYDWSKNKSVSLDEEDIKLVISGRSFNLKPKGAQVANFLLNTSVPLDRSLPEQQLANRLRKKRRPPPLLRSQTMDNQSTSSPISPRSLLDIQKQRKKRQEKLERSQEKERERAQDMIDEASSVVSLLPDELAMMDTLPDHYDEECLNPLCSSINSPRGLETFKKISQGRSNTSSNEETSIDMPE